MKNSNFSKACREISQNLLQITEPTKSNAKFEIKRICTKYSLDKIPKNYEILSMVDGKSYEKLQKILLKKTSKNCIRCCSNCINAKTIRMSSWKMYLLPRWN